MSKFTYTTAVLSVSALLLSGCAMMPKAPIDLSTKTDAEILAMIAATKAEDAAEEAAEAVASADIVVNEDGYTASEQAWIDVMFAGVEDKMVSGGAPVVARSADDVTCIRYYANAVQYMNQPDPMGMVKGVAKTMFAGAVGGVAAGAVSEIGFGNEFLDTAISSSANQIIYQGANTGWNMVLGAKEVDDPMAPIAGWASDIGCPAPTPESMATVEALIGGSLGGLGAVGGVGSLGDVQSMATDALESEAKDAAEDVATDVVTGG